MIGLTLPGYILCTLNPTPQIFLSNSKVISKNNSSRQLIRSLFLHFDLPHNFWVDRLDTTIYLINRLPSKTLHYASPYFKFHNLLGKYQDLWSFICLCFLCLTFHSPNNFSSHFAPCIFIGFPINSKGYKFYDP